MAERPVEIAAACIAQATDSTTPLGVASERIVELERNRAGAELAGRLAGLRLAREAALRRRYRTSGEAAVVALLALADDIDDLIDEARRTGRSGAGG